MFSYLLFLPSVVPLSRCVVTMFVDIPAVLFVFLLSPVISNLEESSYQERHKMMIAAKSESCFFLANLQEGYQLSISYLVASSKDGKQQDITMRLRDPKRMLVTYQGRRTSGNYSDYTVKTAGDYELCFNNRHSHVDSKKVVWQFDIQGDEEVVSQVEEVDIAVNKTLEEYLVEAALVRLLKGWMYKLSSSSFNFNSKLNES